MRAKPWMVAAVVLSLPTLAAALTCGDTITTDTVLNTTLTCSCGATKDYCVQIRNNALLSGSGTIQCGANCPANAIKVDDGHSGRVSGININGFYDAIFVDGGTAQISNVDISSPSHYGIYARNFSDVDVTGGSINGAGDEGVHYQDSTGTLNGVSITNTADEAIYVLGTAGTGAYVDATDVTITTFGTPDGGVGESGINVENQGAAAIFIGTRVSVTGGDSSAGKCIDARSGAIVAVDNTGLVNGSGAAISGLNCKYWLKSSGGSGLAFAADTGGVCCCKLDGTLSSIQLDVPADGTYSPATSACASGCPAGCC
jgi:hypothetical protein